jgi:predicted nucleotidyltransferase
VKRKQLTGRQLEIVRLVKQTAQAILPDAEVILYGSRARGDYQLESDWDFIILTDEPVTVRLEETIRRLMDNLSLDLDVVISAFIENRQYWSTAVAQASPYHQAVEREGVAV